MIALEDFKPKSIDKDAWATLHDKDVCMSFPDSTQVILKDVLADSYPPSFIKIEDLMKGEINAATSLNTISKKAFTLPKDIEWITFPINDLDLAFFSSIAASDSDLFWASEVVLCSEENTMKVQALGLTYSADYCIPKTIEKKMTFKLRWSIFYYLYKLFKGVTKKKLGTIKIGRTQDRVIITTDTEEVLLIAYQSGDIIEYKHSSIPVMKKFISKLEWKARDDISKKLLTTTGNTLFKHLAKPFKDTVFHLESTYCDKYTDNLYYSLYLFKKR